MTSLAGRDTPEIEEESRAASLVRRAAYAILLFFAAAAAFNGFYTKIGFREDDRARGFQAILDGSAKRPYIYRQLLPTIANRADRLAPEKLKQKLAALRSDDGRGFYASLFSAPIALDPAYSFRYLVLYLESFAGAVLAVFVFYLVCRNEGCSREVAIMSAALLILLIPYVQTRGGGYYYDFPEAALLGLAVLLARRAHWLWLAPVAFLGAWNKETFVLAIIGLWPLLRRRSNPVVASIQVILLEFVAGSVYLVNRLRFAANPGGTVEFHLKDQLAYLAHPVLWLLKFGRVYGVFLPELATLVPALLLAAIVWFAWRRLPPEIRQYAALMAIINVPLFLLFCMPGEIRDLSLLWIVVLLSIAATFSRPHRSGVSATHAALPESEVSDAAKWETARSQS